MEERDARIAFRREAEEGMYVPNALGIAPPIMIGRMTIGFKLKRKNDMHFRNCISESIRKTGRRKEEGNLQVRSSKQDENESEEAILFRCEFSPRIPGRR